jgi:ATP-dependent helicase YprA (DUF1998 family)
MKPLEVSKAIEKRIRRQIRKSLPVERSVPSLESVIDRFFDEDHPLSKDPYLEIVMAYEASESLQDLADAGVIHAETARIFACYFAGEQGADPSKIRLHAHQATAIREVCGNGKNLVVCSGTGSGKTETFLIPLIDSLVRELAAGELTPGVRAMILYPMNALVNDQIRRLRNILRWAPEIRFGKYTGETEHEDQIKGDRLEEVESALNGLAPMTHSGFSGLGFDDEGTLTNEVATRRKWKQEPAHILVTNYSMLERLLLQPQTSNLFGSNWKFIVLDEAHCYSGALGTEIAWLVRRVKRRVEEQGTPTGQLRFLATSATLISDHTLTDDQKAEQIRERFASRLFPATANSFAVQFGNPAMQPDSNANQAIRPSRQYIDLLAVPFRPGELMSLFETSQQYLGRKSWQERLKNGLQTVLGQAPKVAIGDLLVVVREAQAAAEIAAGDDDVTPGAQALNATALLDPASETHVRALLDVMTASVGRLNEHRAWRDWLHDPSDPSPSSVPGDTYCPNGKTQQKPLGNRLYLLSEWSKPVDEWSQDALEWLLQVSSRLAAATEVEIEPVSMLVTMSNSCQEALTRTQQQLEIQIANDRTLAASLDQQWASALDVSSSGNFQETLAVFLSEDPRLASLRNQLASVTTPDQANDATSGAVASAVFSDDPDRGLALDALISLGTLAKEPGKRTPLLDVRYHHMVRGIESPGLRLEAGPNNGINVQLLPELVDDGLAFGLCRQCGQPFVLGYAETPALEGLGPFRLSPSRSHGRNCLHAFAWARGELPEDKDAPEAGDLNDLWLNTRSCELQRGQQAPAQPGWVKMIAHGAPHATYKEFIGKCPTCGDEHRPRAESRYGIITPYEASGDTVRMAAMEEMARQAGASNDPEARGLPGEGRKLLVFSDSRSGSSGMALGFQEYFAETTVGRLVAEAAKEASQAEEVTDEQILATNGIPKDQWPVYMTAPPFMQMQRTQWAENTPQGPSFGRVSERLAKMIKSENLIGLLSVAEVDLDEKPVGELDTDKAAQWRLLNAVLKKGRYAMRTRQSIRLSVRQFQNANNTCLQDLELNPDESGRQMLGKVLERILSWLADRVQVDLPSGFPAENIQRYRKPISYDGVDQTIRWHSNQATSTLNRYLPSIIAEVTSFWFELLRAEVKTVNGRPALEVAERFADLDDATLQEVASKVCRQRAANMANSLPTNVALNASTAAKTAVLTVIRRFFLNLSAEWLRILWPMFTQAADKLPAVLVDSGNEQYLLNPDALWIYPGSDDAPLMTDIPVWAEEDAQLAVRDIIPLRIEEHTAQLAKARGSNYQRAFADGHINILSCSTTFEMGVDLGDLSCVFLNGMPPNVANYRQRAGRAGRRPGSPSYVLTFIGRRDHDRYFWDRPGELLYAEMQEPKIYLENPMFRARHLRAEALHDFLVWLEGGKRLEDNAATRFVEQNGTLVPQPASKRRKWSSIGDLFAGVTVANKRNNDRFYPVTWRYHPLVDELSEWKVDREQSLQSYLEQVDGIGANALPYQVAADLVWQLKDQAQVDPPVAPYDLTYLEHEWEYRLLGGPNWPVAGKNGLLNAQLEDARPDIRRLSVQAQVRHFLPDNATTVRPFQKHLLQEHTITWLSRCRVLPKYGFPVDVINLIPDQNDPFGRNVKLERDLKIGLFEYAPGQVVTADKRRYPSAKAVVWSNGDFNDVQSDNLQERWICSTCHEPDWSLDPNSPNQCRYCGPDGQLQQVRLCFPDAFRAERSTPSFKIKGDRGSPIHVHTRAFRPQGVALPNSGLVTKESESGSITYINQGPGHRGFTQGHQSFALCHEVRTDIAGWMLAPALFQHGNLLANWANESCGVRKRLESAMRSAMHAILRSVAIEKGIEEREVQGILQPGVGQQGEMGLVLFDDSTGGGGAVLDLVLTGNPQIDGERSGLIRRILQRAISLCENCSCGNGSDRMPISKDELIALPTPYPGDYRLATSCYRCLRSHRNQRDHVLLDRFDALAVIKQIMENHPPSPTNGHNRHQLNGHTGEHPCSFTFEDDLGRPVNLVRSTELLVSNTWALVKLPGGFAYGKWAVMDRIRNGDVMKRLRLSNGVGLLEPVLLDTARYCELQIWVEN